MIPAICSSLVYGFTVLDICGNANDASCLESSGLVGKTVGFDSSQFEAESSRTGDAICERLLTLSEICNAVE